MSRLVCMQGLAASGKTTKARELLVEYGNGVRLNRDDLRAMLHTGGWSGKKEGITRDVARGMAQHLLLRNIGVLIIDDTNLNDGVVQSWKALALANAATFEIVRLDTPLEECLRRDALRQHPVGRQVIIGMALQYGLYPKPKEGIVLCDIDGTLANIEHRKNFVQQEPKDWHGFFGAMADDEVRMEVLRQVEGYFFAGHEVFFVSGRPDNYRAQTEAWLRERCCWPAPTVFMRRAGDHRPDTVVKQQMLQTYFPDKSWITCVFDDRKIVVDMWKNEGLVVVDVGNGIEF